MRRKERGRYGRSTDRFNPEKHMQVYRTVTGPSEHQDRERASLGAESWTWFAHERRVIKGFFPINSVAML